MKCKLAVVISDSHSAFHPEVWKRIQIADYIIHAGDTSTIDIVQDLKLITDKTYIVQGNVESPQTTEILPEELYFNINNYNFYLIHDLEDRKKITLNENKKKLDFVIFGHTHKIYKKKAGNILFLNPGSCGPKRFKNGVPSFAILFFCFNKVYVRVFRLWLSIFASGDDYY